MYWLDFNLPQRSEQHNVLNFTNAFTSSIYFLYSYRIYIFKNIILQYYIYKLFYLNNIDTILFKIVVHIQNS